MKTSTRRILGGAIFAASLVGVCLIGWPEMRQLGSAQHGDGPGYSYTSTAYSMEIGVPQTVFLLTGIAGLLALVWPARKSGLPPELPR
jgi:hypothetical protein